jgi:hypothetical protein
VSWQRSDIQDKMRTSLNDILAVVIQLLRLDKSMTMKNSVKAAFVAMTMSVATAQAQFTPSADELLLGFTIPSSTGDLIIDLGLPSKVGVGGTNVVDLNANGSVGLSASALKTQLNSLYGSMNTLSWGVVGSHFSNTHNAAIYFTVLHDAAPHSKPGSFGGPNAAISTAGDAIVSGNQAVVDPTQQTGQSWSEAIAPGPKVYSFTTTFGASPNLTTPATFASGTNHIIADLYYTAVNLTNVVLEGSLTLGSDGSFTFTPASKTTPPPAPMASISHGGDTITVSFSTVNGAVYSLHFTNNAGLLQPVSNWAVSGNTITGNGQTASFTDTTSATDRVYRVGVH